MFFFEAPIGTTLMYEGKCIVKLTNQYFNIRPYRNGRGNRMVNAMYETTGELLYLADGLSLMKAKNAQQPVRGHVRDVDR